MTLGVPGAWFSGPVGSTTWVSSVGVTSRALCLAPLLVSATLEYSGKTTDESSEVFGTTNRRVVYTRVMGTNAETQVYSRLTSETAVVPFG